MTFVLIPHPGDYKRGVRVLRLVSRNKDEAVTARSRVVVTRNEQDFDTALKTLAEAALPGQRIYASVDARNERVARHNFDLAKLTADYAGDMDFMYRLDRAWSTALMQTNARHVKHFLFDLDTPEQEALFETHLGSFQHYMYSTKNGTHAVTGTFNHTIIPPELKACLQMNGMMLWGFDNGA